MNQTAHNMTSNLLQTIKNERLETGCASMYSDPPYLSEIGSEVETWPMRPMNYNIHNHRKTECDYQ
jgi:hypothetical protein